MTGNHQESTPNPLEVNVTRCRVFSAYVPCLLAAKQPSDPFSLTHRPQHHQLRALLHLVGICDRINWDFLLSTLAANLWHLTDGFKADRLAATPQEEFERAFAGYRRGGEDLDCARRLRALTAISAQLKAEGIVERLMRSERIAGPGGAMSLIRDLPAYRDDPLLKKANTVLHQLMRRKLIVIQDEDEIDPSVDYHMMRLYLRTRRVEVRDPDVAGRLIRRENVPLEVITRLRSAVAEAVRCTAGFAGVPALVLNEAEWAFSRKECERDVVSCFPAVQCPISDICPSAGLLSVRMFTEPESRHGYY
jgi:hypothetical protein